MTGRPGQCLGILCVKLLVFVNISNDSLHTGKLEEKKARLVGSVCSMVIA